MLYPVYVRSGDGEHAHGAEVPDFPGCYSAADEFQQLPGMIQEAIELYCAGENLDIPPPSNLADLRKDPNYQGGTWIFVDVDLDKLDTRKERINLSVPVNALREIDAYAAAHGYNRSGFMVQAALKVTRAKE